MADFLFYWTTDQLSQAIRLKSIPHAASEQFSRVRRGDRVWISGRFNGLPELFTIGYIDVASKLGAKSAQVEMRRRLPGYKIWAASTHILSRHGSEIKAKSLSLASLYQQLEFDSRGRKVLKLTKGHPNAQQLQTMRQLTPASAKLLRDHWGSFIANDARILAAKRAVDFDSLDAQRTVLARLEQNAARALLLQNRQTAKCAFCGRDVPASLLVAAHIKPRASCSTSEKRQIDLNIVGLCKLGCDDLFERGYVEVFDGVIILGKATPTTASVTSFIAPLVNRRVLGWTEQREALYRWRRENRSKIDAVPSIVAASDR